MFNNIFQKYLSVKNIVFFIISIIFLVFLTKIQDIVILFFASFVIACSLEPIVKKLMKKYRRTTASIITLIAVMLVICTFIIPLIVVGSQEIKNFIASIPQYLDNIQDFLYSIPFLKDSIKTQVDMGGVISSASNLTSKLLNETINISKNIGSALVYLVASILITYYFMSDRETIRSTYLKLFPSPMRDRADEIIDSISKKVGGYVIAQITTMASVGIIMTLGLLILRVDYAILLGLLTALFDIVPVVGPGIALVICLISAYKSGFLILALITVIFALAQLAENNLVRPYIFSKFLDLHPLIIYLFLFITAKYLGVIGVIFAPAIAATAVVLIEELYMKNIN